MTFLVVKVDGRFPRRSVDERGRNGTAVLAEAGARIVHVHQDLVGTAGVPDFLGGVARDPLGTPVPVGDPSLRVDEVDAVVQVLDQLSEELRRIVCPVFLG